MKPEAVVFDIDSTLADTLHRKDMILPGDQRPNTDWLAYAKACGGDTPTAAADLAKLLWPTHYKIILLTSRPAKAHEETQDWLRSHGVRFDLMAMDESEDGSDPVEYKINTLIQLRAHYDIKLLVEDAWDIKTAVEGRLGIPTLVVRVYDPKVLELRY